MTCKVYQDSSLHHGQNVGSQQTRKPTPLHLSVNQSVSQSVNLTWLAEIVSEHPVNEQSITLILVWLSGQGPSSIRLKFCSVHTFILLVTRQGCYFEQWWRRRCTMKNKVQS